MHRDGQCLEQIGRSITMRENSHNLHAVNLYVLGVAPYEKPIPRRAHISTKYNHAVREDCYRRFGLLVRVLCLY
jgi:hypothetical protein